MATGTFTPKAKDEIPNKEGKQAIEKGKEALDKGKEAFDKVKEAGSHAAEQAKQAVSSVGEMATEAATAVGNKADELTATAGSDIQKFADRMEARAPHEGVLGQASHAVAETIRGGGKYMEEAKLSGMAGDVADLVKNHPIPAILIGIGFGFLLGRTMRT